MKPAKVVMLVTNDAVSDPRVDKEAHALAADGYAVTVLAWDRAGEAPTLENRGHVTYERLGPRAPYGGGLRSLDHFRRYWRAAADRALEIRPAFVHCHDLDTAPAGLRVRRGATPPPRVILDMHELYRESGMVPQRGFVGTFARAAVRVLERRAFRVADAILVANPGTTDYYAALGVGEKLVVVENAPDISNFSPVQRPEGVPFTVGYFGQKRYPGELQVLMETVQLHPQMAALLVGGGVAADMIAGLARTMERIEVAGRFDYAELPELYARCDVVYAVYDVRLGNVRTLFPVKVMEAMASALPVIVAEGTWIGGYVAEHGIGAVVPAGDRAALEGALLGLARDPSERRAMGQRGRALVEAGLNWDAASRRLVALYRSLQPEEFDE